MKKIKTIRTIQAIVGVMAIALLIGIMLHIDLLGEKVDSMEFNELRIAALENKLNDILNDDV